MPRLTDHDFRLSYGPGDDRLGEFYIPALSSSVPTTGWTGYFSTTRWR